MNNLRDYTSINYRIYPYTPWDTRRIVFMYLWTYVVLKFLNVTDTLCEERSVKYSRKYIVTSYRKINAAVLAMAIYNIIDKNI